MTYLETIHLAADYVLPRLKGRTPLVGIVLGSGLGKLADQIEDPIVIPYEIRNGQIIVPIAGLLEYEREFK